MKRELFRIPNGTLRNPLAFVPKKALFFFPKTSFHRHSDLGGRHCDTAVPVHTACSDPSRLTGILVPGDKLHFSAVRWFSGSQRLEWRPLRRASGGASRMTVALSSACNWAAAAHTVQHCDCSPGNWDL